MAGTPDGRGRRTSSSRRRGSITLLCSLFALIGAASSALAVPPEVGGPAAQAAHDTSAALDGPVARDAPAAPDGPEQRALALLDSLWANGDGRTSLGIIDSLLETISAKEHPRFRVELLTRRGARHSFYGDAIGAGSNLREAVDLATSLADTTLLCGALRWLGVAQDQQGHMAEAAEVYARMLGLAQTSGLEGVAGYARLGLAYHALQTDRAREAYELYQSAVGAFQRGEEHEGEASALNGMGRALSNIGAYREALVAFRRALEVARLYKVRAVEGHALNNLGSLEYSLGDPGVAVADFAAALELHRSTGNLRDTITPRINMAICESQLERFQVAEDSLQSCLRDARAGGYHDLEAVVMNHLADLSGLEDRWRESAARYRQALAQPEELTARMRLKALIGLGEALGKQDSLPAALATLAAAEDLMRGQDRHDLRPLLRLRQGACLLAEGRAAEAETHFLDGARGAETLGQPMLRVRLLSEAARSARRLPGGAERALGALERAAELWEEARDVPLDPEWREQRGSSGPIIYTTLAAALLERPGPERKARIATAFDRLQPFKARTLQDRMLGPGRAREDSLVGPPEDVATLAVIQQRVLRPGELFLDTYAGDDTSIVFAVTPDSCRVVWLPCRGYLQGRLQRYHEFHSTFPTGEAGAAGGDAPEESDVEVARLLLGGVEDLIRGCRRVVISADGPLALMPFALLVEVVCGGSSSAVAAAAAGAAHVADTARRPDAARVPETVLVPSATVLAWLRSGALAPAPPATLPGTPSGALLAEADSGVRLLAIGAREGPAGQPLPGAVEEVGHLAGRYRRAEAVVLPSRRKRETIDLLRGPQVIHLASHAVLNDEFPWQSRIMLGSGRGGEDLRASEIAALRLPARLVVLASCATGAGTVASGEGVLGLTQAFLSAGVPSVVATLWPVEDLSTRRFMRVFYEGLARGQCAAAALRDAQVRFHAQPETRDPFYWAGFVLVGEGETRVTLAERSSMARLVVEVGGLPAALAERGALRWALAGGLIVLLAALGAARRALPGGRSKAPTRSHQSR